MADHLKDLYSDPKTWRQKCDTSPTKPNPKCIMKYSAKCIPDTTYCYDENPKVCEPRNRFPIYQQIQCWEKVKQDGCDKPEFRCFTKRVELPYQFGIVSAFAPEQVELNKAFSKVFPPIDIAGRRFNRGILDGKLVVSAISGIGMVNAAITTQMMITYFDPTYLLYSGIAGGMNPANNIGDVVVSKRWVQYHYQKYERSNTDNTGLLNDFFDFGIDFPNRFFQVIENKVLSFRRPGCEGCDNPDPNPADNIIKPLQIPPLKTIGACVPMYVETLQNPGDAFLPVPPEKFFFDVSPILLNATEKAIAKGITFPEKICLNPPACTDLYEPIAKVGDAGVSADTFLDNAEERLMVVEQFAQGGIVIESADMESASFTHVCFSNKKPFLVIRSMSDLAGGDAGINPVLQFVAVAAQNSVFMLRAILAEIPSFDPYCECEYRLCQTPCPPAPCPPCPPAPCPPYQPTPCPTYRQPLYYPHYQVPGSQW
jgi:adenosylhomocysteine nucleosidase